MPKLTDAEKKDLLSSLAHSNSAAKKSTRKRKPCESCKGEGWFVTQTAGTVMCSNCRGKGHK